MQDNELPEFLNNFGDYLIGIKNLSKIYVKNLKITIKQFLNFINTHKLKVQYDSIKDFTLNDFRKIANKDIYCFMFYLAENHYKVSSRIVKTEHLRLFFDYLYRIKHNLFKEPFKQIKNEKNNCLKLPNYLSLEESKKLLRVYANSTKKNEIRNKTIIHLILNCGLRLSEVINLQIKDIDFSNNKFIIFGKGNKERIGYLNKSTKAALLEYMEIRKNIKGINEKDKNILFIGNNKKRLSSSNLERQIDKAYEKANLDKQIYKVHTLRHTCATLLYKAGIDIKTIQELLGHVQVDTTEIYTHLHDEEVMKEMFNHPLSKFKMKDAMQYAV